MTKTPYYDEYKANLIKYRPGAIWTSSRCNIKKLKVLSKFDAPGGNWRTVERYEHYPTKSESDWVLFQILNSRDGYGENRFCIGKYLVWTKHYMEEYYTLETRASFTTVTSGLT